MAATRDDLTMKALHPFNGRVLVVESPVDEAERASGLIVPVKAENVLRGVIQEVDEEFHKAAPTWAGDASLNILAPGLVIYFRTDDDHCTLIGDVYVVSLSAILAYERDGA